MLACLLPRGAAELRGVNAASGPTHKKKRRGGGGEKGDMGKHAVREAQMEQGKQSRPAAPGPTLAGLSAPLRRRHGARDAYAASGPQHE